MLTAELSHRAKRFLARLPEKQRQQVSKKILRLLEYPRPPDSKKLKGFPFLSAHSGEYRIIYNFDQSTLRVELIGKRNDDEVYRELNRLR